MQQDSHRGHRGLPPINTPTRLASQALPAHPDLSPNTQGNCKTIERNEASLNEDIERSTRKKERFARPRKRANSSGDAGTLDCDNHTHNTEPDPIDLSPVSRSPALTNSSQILLPPTLSLSVPLTTVTASPQLAPLSTNNPPRMLSKLYGDVEYEEVTSHPLPTSPLHVTPRHIEQHNAVFIESTATGKFKKTDAGSLPPLQQRQNPSAQPSGPHTPLSRAFIFEQSFTLLSKVFLFIQGLLAGYGLFQIYASIAYWKGYNEHTQLVGIGDMLGITHRTFLVLSVGGLLSIFGKYNKKATAPPQAFSAGSTPGWLQAFRSPKSDIFLVLCYLVIVVSLLVDTPKVNKAEAYYRAQATVTVNLRSYFILNSIRSVAAVLAWFAVIVELVV